MAGGVRERKSQDWAARFIVVRRFAEWLSGLDPAHEMIPRELIPSRAEGRRPISTARPRSLASSRGGQARVDLRPARIDLLDVVRAHRGHRPQDQRGPCARPRRRRRRRRGAASVRQTRQGSPGPLELSVVERLTVYIAERDRILGKAHQAFFVQETCKGTRLTDCSARYNFAHTCQRIGLRAHLSNYCRHGRGPRIHDLRHSFAARTMIDWYRDRQRPGARDDPADDLSGP